MKGKNSNMKKHGAAVLAIVIVLVMILSVVAPVIGSIVYGAPMSGSTMVKSGDTASQQLPLSKEPKEIDDGQFEITASIGYDSKYIVGRNTPFKFIVTNNGSDFKGELQMKVYLFESSERYSSQYAIFYVPLELSKNATKEVEMTAQVASITPFFTVSLVNEKDNAICVKNFSATAKDPSTVWTGVLSDNPAELVYIKKNDSYYNQQTAYYYSASGVEYFDTLYLDSKTFPTDSSVLNNFRMLIINDFNTANLSQEQKDAIKQWVNEGGMLIIGTGVNAKKVLSGLGDITKFTVSDEVANVSLENIGDVLVQNVSNFGSVAISDAKMENSNSLLEQDGKVTTSRVKVGNGTVILHNFDLGKSPIPNIGDIEILLRTFYENENPSIFNLSHADNYSYNPVSDWAGRMAPEKGSMMNIIFIIIGVYVIFVGPVLYIVLKKKDKREKGWVIIPFVAVATTIVIYIAGSSSYYRSSIINMVSKVDIENGQNYAKAQIYAGLRSGDKGSLKFTADEDFDIDVSEMDYGEIYGDDEVCALKINTDSASEITYFGKASWDLNKFATEKEIDMGGALDAKIALKGDTLVGTIVNNTNFDFEDVVLHIGSVYYKIDNCMSGETVDVNYKIEPVNLQNGNYYNSYDEIQKLFGVEDGYYNFDGANEEYFTKYGRTSILGDMDDTELSKTTSADAPISMKIYAFNKLPLIEGNKYINGKKMNEMAENLFVMDVAVALEDNAEFDLPYGLIGPYSITDEKGDSFGDDSNYIYMNSEGNVYCNFALPQNVNLELFQIRWDNSPAMASVPEIFNLDTGEWEKLSQDEITDFKCYDDDSGIITIRVKVQEGGEIEVPQIRLKGGKK
ncbi:MAG: hypothetical protein PHY44_05090 [Lachnospiraceae bacterium]|nr:hypothetical protein [Lachnospiraceae bacterium]